MAHQLYQLATVQETFATRIQQKIQNHRDQVRDRADDVPLLGWLLAPLAGIVFDVKEGRNVRRGERGEEAVLNALLGKLPDSWFIFHSVVVEPQPDDFAQIDLLLIGPAGMFLVETKAWRGSYKAYRDTWHQREGNVWTVVSSPTEQVRRQARKLSQWLSQHRQLTLPPSPASWVRPVVIFTRAQWLRASACSAEVFEGTRPLVAFLKAQAEGVLATDQVDQLCDLIIRMPTPIVEPQPTLPAQDFPTSAPICPRCGLSMVLRTARQGSHTGKHFYGCPNFPRCREVVSLGGGRSGE